MTSTASDGKPTPDDETTADAVETRRVLIFLALAFGISWATAGVIALTGGLTDSPELAAGITLATALLPTAYMFGPALANLFTRLLTGEGWDALYLRLGDDRNLPYWAAAWFLPAVLVLAGVGIFYAAFPEHFDPTLGAARAILAQVEEAGGGLPFGPRGYVLLQLGLALTIGPAINTVFAFGEEFGWRAYLLPKLLPLGGQRAALATGVIWGVWHWPIIAMGYNYGFGYVGAPWLGMLAMAWFTVVAGVFLAWVALRGGSVWPAAIGHGAINAVAGIGLLFVRGQPSSLLGPAATGVVVSLPFAALALYLARKPSALAPPDAPAP